MKNFKRLRVELTFIFTLITASIGIVTALLLYFSLSLSLESNARDTLTLAARQLAGAYEVSQVRTESGVVEEFHKNFKDLTDSLDEEEVAYDVWNDQFHVVASSQYQPVGADVLRAYIDYLFTEHPSSGLVVTDYQNQKLDLKICTYLSVESSGRVLIVQTIRDMGTERAVLKTPTRWIILTLGAGIILSVVAGYFLSGKTLAPIKKSYQMQRDFLADASHELRTPVSVIQTNLEVLKDHEDQTVESQLNWVDNAYFETKRMKAIIENLLTLAKADAGEMITNFEPVDLTYLVLMITERMQGLAVKKQIRLTADCEEAELFVRGSEKSLDELLTILIDNAVKYTPEGGSVTVKVFQKDEKIKVIVQDTGIGIPKDAVSHIFERFYRVDKARSRAAGGTGLGLSIAKWILDEHRASIKVESTEGVGTKMILTFPVFDVEES